jgi:hypothetical protein
MPIRFKAVSAETKRLLDVADQVNRACRALVAMGAGNQRPNVSASQGRSHYLTGEVQSHPNYVWDRPLRNGGVTCAYGAGNCQDQAAVTYTILRSTLSGAETTSFCVNWVIKHSFATIGIPGTDPANEVVCVDPWPIHCQAVLLEDHFCKNSLTVLRHKVGGKNPNYMTRLNKHAPVDALAKKQYADAHVWDVDAINTGGGMWTHEYCSINKITWVYKVRPTWIADDQRPKCHGCNKDFSRTRWQHHCRSCGEIFCDDCSKGRTVVGIPATQPGKPVINLSNGAVRVCAPCRNQITADGFGG